jgi:predicted small lipoprotein YifL
MNHYKFTSLVLAVVVFSTLSACGKKEEEKSASKAATSSSSSSSQPAKAAYNDNLDHQAFERKSADLCVKKELSLRKKENPREGNNETADATLASLCECIAKEESKHLTKQEARKFVQENEYPMSLMIKAGQAEEACAKK